APRRALPKQGRCFAANPRFTFHALRFTAPGSEARTLLADFFSILLEGRPTLADSWQSGRLCWAISSPAAGGI
ncbi:MAG: hypothetical protein ACREIJ_08020, partial [Nitrospiraceae bacterium]